MRQHEIIWAVGDLVDERPVRRTATIVLRPITAATIRVAHELVEGGRVIGIVVGNDKPEP